MVMIPGMSIQKYRWGEILNVFRAQDDALIAHIDQINNILSSDDPDLDKLQEIINYIKENRRQIEVLAELIAQSGSDDTISLVGSYSNWGSLTYQSQFNSLVYNKIQQIENAVGSGKIRHEEKVRGDSRVKHDLNTLNFVIDAYDTVTMFTVPLKVKRIDNNTVDVLFDSLPPNTIQLTIKKI